MLYSFAAWDIFGSKAPFYLELARNDGLSQGKTHILLRNLPLEDNALFTTQMTPGTQIVTIAAGLGITYYLQPNF